MSEARWLDRDALAEYVSIRVDEIPRFTRRGKLPAPSYHLGPRSPRWDRQKVDAAFGGAVASRSPEAMVASVVQEILDGRA